MFKSAYKKQEDGTFLMGSYKTIPDGYIEYTIGSEPVELKAHMDAISNIKLMTHYKNLYLGVVNDKLKELDYDSLATVKLWEGDATFGAEATKILAWYKSIISYNYALITSVNAGGAIPTDAEYLAGIPAYV